MITYVLVNGPAYSGKSYLCDRVEEELIAMGVPVMQAHLKDPLKDMLEAFVQDYYPESAHLTYAELKEKVIGGTTGRQLLIGLGEGLRGRDIECLPRALVRKVEMKMKHGVVLVDDLGFPDEYSYFVQQSSWNFFNVYMEERSSRLYGHGEQFDNDSRYCLRGFANVIDPLPKYVAEQALALLGA